MRYSLRFGLVCILLYMMILMFLSNYAIRPFVENVASQKRFITNAGHELKTPIAIISANAEALELISGKSQWTDNILFQVKRVTRLINELIMLAKMGEKNQQLLKRETVDISRTFEEAVQSFAPVVEGEKKTLVKEIHPNLQGETDPSISTRSSPSSWTMRPNTVMRAAPSGQYWNPMGSRASGPLCPMITRTVPRWTIPISLNGFTGG